jgi:hypothetical protein
VSVPKTITVERRGGYSSPPQVAMWRPYLALFSSFQLDPIPFRSFSKADWLVWEFSPPRGDSLHIDIAARLDPSRQTGAAGRTAVLEEERPVLEVGYATRVFP